MNVADWIFSGFSLIYLGAIGVGMKTSNTIVIGAMAFGLLCYATVIGALRGSLEVPE